MSLFRALNSASEANSLKAWVMRVKTVNMTSTRTLIPSPVVRCPEKEQEHISIPPEGKQSDDKLDHNLRVMRDLLIGMYSKTHSKLDKLTSKLGKVKYSMDKLQHTMDTTLLTRADVPKAHDVTSHKGELRPSNHSHGHRGRTLGQKLKNPGHSN